MHFFETKEKITIVSIIVAVITVMIINECLMYRSIENIKRAIIQISYDIDKQKLDMFSRCNENIIRYDDNYWETKACMKNALKIIDEKKQAYSEIIAEYGNLSYWDFRKKVITKKRERTVVNNLDYTLQDVLTAFKYAENNSFEINTPLDLDNILIRGGYSKVLPVFTYNSISKITVFWDNKNMSLTEFQTYILKQNMLSSIYGKIK